MDAATAFAHATAKPSPDSDRFYGPIENAAIGAGMILAGLEYPMYLTGEDGANGGYGVVEGLALVLTHECDMDEENKRPFNDSGVVCPILPLEQMADSLHATITDDAAGKWFEAVTDREVNRFVYIPVIADALPYGGYLYLNLLTSTHRSKMSIAHKICMLSSFGLREIDLALERHFRRPKADRLAFQTDFDFSER